MAASIAVYSGWNHNPQQEIRDSVSIDWPHLSFIGIAWFLIVGVPVSVGASASLWAGRALYHRFRANSQDSGIRAPQAWWLLLLYLAPQLGAGVLGGFLFGMRSALRGEELADATAVSAALSPEITGPVVAVSTALGGFLVLLSVLRRSRSQPSVRQQLGLSLGSPRALVTGAGVGLAIGGAYLVAGHLMPRPPDFIPGPFAQTAYAEGWLRHLWAFTVIVLAPPVEELVFRGALYGGLSRSWGTAPAAVVATVLFVVLHFPESQTYLPAVAAITTFAAVALVLRVKARALGPAITAHMGYNVAMVLWARLSVAA